MLLKLYLSQLLPATTPCFRCTANSTQNNQSLSYRLTNTGLIRIWYEYGGYIVFTSISIYNE